MKYLILNILFILFATVVYAQDDNIPQVGKPMPYFEFNDVISYSKNKVNLNDLKGKWFVLDFWNKGCTACIKSFPKINSIVKEFTNKVEIIQVGVNDNKYNNGIKSMYKTLQKRMNYEIPMAFDSIYDKKWNIPSYPHILIVDNKGVLRAKTYSLNKNDLQILLDSNRNLFPITNSQRNYIPVNTETPYLIKGNGGIDSNFIIRSILAKSDPRFNREGNGNLNSGYEYEKFLKDGTFQILRISLRDLYNVAYFGQKDLWPEDVLYGKVNLLPSVNWKSKPLQIFPIIESKDSTGFFHNTETWDGFFTYSTSLPTERRTKENLMKIIREDLNRGFGYKASIEIRKMPVWKLITTTQFSDEKLKTKSPGGKFKGEGSVSTGVNIKNGTVLKLIKQFWVYNQLDCPIIDETGINFEIDYKLDAVMSDLKSVIKGLQKLGLDLVKGEKEMQVLVIRDPESIKTNSGQVIQTN